MPTAYIHIGEHKTGTTSFQSFIATQRTWLKEQGFFVPNTGQRAMGAHHSLVRAISGLPSPEASFQLLPRLKAEIEEAGYPDVLISSEMMTHIMRSYELLERYTNFFSSFGYDVVVILFLREPLAAWNSKYSQNAKTFRTTLTFAEFIQACLDELANTPYILWDNLIKHPGVREIIRPYNFEVRQEGIVKAILNELGISVSPPVADPQKNTSPSPTEVFLSRRFARELEASKVEFTLSQRPALIKALRSLPVIDARTYRGITSEIVAKVDTELQDWKVNLASRLWGKSWDTCYPEAGNYPEPNDMEYLNATEIDWSVINPLEQQLREAWEAIKAETADEAPTDWPLLITDAMRAAGIDIDTP